MTALIEGVIVEHPPTPDRNIGLAVNRTYPIDCVQGLKQIQPGSVDVAVTSPPYWGQRLSDGLGVEEDPRSYVADLIEVLDLTMRALKPSGLLWLNIGDAYNTPVNWRIDDHKYSSLGPDGTGLDPSNSAYTKRRATRRAFVSRDAAWLQYGNLLALPYRVVIGLCDLGYLFRGEVIWEKTRPMPEGRCRRPHRRHESIYVFAKDERHNFKVAPPVGTVWKLVQTPNQTTHCSPFPIDLPRQCIDASGVEGCGVVLDPFMGSGSSARAARELGHDFIGFEIDAAMCEIANAQAGVSDVVAFDGPSRPPRGDRDQVALFEEQQ